MIKLLVITGPTASGKTGLGVALAEKLDGEIISADSMQIYRGMEIGTAAATEEERRGIPHYMIACKDPAEEYSVSAYRQEAEGIIKDIARRGKLPIVVGGTGMYIDALLYDMNYTSAGKNEELRREFAAFAEENGTQALHDRLRQVDPESAEKLHKNDVKRIIRALEIFYLSGSSKSSQRQEIKIKPYLSPVIISLECSDRQYLYDRIDRRVDSMMQQGLPDEVRALLEAGVPADAQSMKAIGYRQLVPCLMGEADLGQAVEQIKKESRHYAKRQLTWMRRRDCLRLDIAGKTAEQLLSEALDLPPVAALGATRTQNGCMDKEN